MILWVLIFLQFYVNMKDFIMILRILLNHDCAPKN